MKMSQRTAVYTAVMAVFSDKGVEFEDGGNLASVMTDDIRKAVHGIVVEGFKAGEVSFEDTPSNREKLHSDSKLSGYVSGLISNWFRKDPRFNGNTKYTPKNPGSRAGQGDATLKTLRALATKFAGDTTKSAQIAEAISARVAQIHAEKSKSISLTPEQVAALPTELRTSLGL